MMEKLTYDNINKSKLNICSIYFNESCSDDINFSLDDLKLSVDKNIFNKHYDYGYDEFKKYFIDLQNKQKNEIEKTLKDNTSIN